MPHVELSSARKIRDFRSEHQPIPENCHDNGIWVPLKLLFQLKTKDILENLAELSPDLSKQIEMSLQVKATCGFDANGGNTVAKSCPKQDTSIIHGGIRIFEVNGPDEHIYVENSSGPLTETPWFLIPSRKF